MRTFKVFLEQAPPLIAESVKAETKIRGSGPHYWDMVLPALSLFCRSKECQGDLLLDSEHDTLRLGNLTSP